MAKQHTPAAVPLPLEEVILRLSARLRLAQSIVHADMGPDAREAADALLEASISQALKDAEQAMALLPFPISAYEGEPIEEWIVECAARVTAGAAR